MSELKERSQKACTQLLEHGGGVWNETILEVLERIVTINSELFHGFNKNRIIDHADEAISLLDDIITNVKGE